MKNTSLTRKELYDIVWLKPLTTLAKEFSYSASGIRKLCKKHNIPLPKAGYWMKLKHNKKVTKIHLPKGDNTVVIKLNAEGFIVDNSIHPNAERTKIKSKILSDRGLQLTVPVKIKNLHPLVQAVKNDLKGKKPSLWSKSKGLIFTSKDVLNIEVSKSNVARALKFMDTFIKLLNKRGHDIKINNDTYVIINEERLKVRLKEFTKRVENQDNKSIWDSYDYIPSGELSFRIQNYPEKIFRDGKTSSIEEQLLNILVSLELKAKQQKERRIEHEIQNKLYQEKLAKERAYKLLKETELDDFNKLFQNATRWHKSQYIKNYINEFKEFAIKKGTLNNDKKQWIDWAIEKADWYDPLIEKEVELLDDIDRDTLQIKKKSWY